MADELNTQGDDNKGLEALADKLAELGLKIEPIAKAIESGILMVKPDKIDSLPDDIKGQIDQKVAEGKQEASRTTKDQLYDTIEKLKKDNLEMKQFVDAEKEKKLKLEQEEAAKRAAEEQSKMTTDEKVQKALEEMRNKIESQKSESDNKVLELAKKLKIAEQKVVLEKHKAKYGDQLIHELIPDLEHNPDISEEDLAAKVELAHTKYVEIFNAGKGSSTAEEEQAPSQFGRKTTSMKSIGQESHIPNNRKPPIDLELLSKTTNVADLDAALAKFTL